MPGNAPLHVVIVTLDNHLSGAVERGPNDMSIVLERDPYGVLPASACAPGETLLEVEDFQDGRAQGWGPIDEAIEYNAPNGWAIETDPLAEGMVTLRTLVDEGRFVPARPEFVTAPPLGI